MLFKIIKLVKENKLNEAYKEVRKYGKITKDFSFENLNGSYRSMNIFYELTDWQIQLYNGDVIDIDFKQRRL